MNTWAYVSPCGFRDLMDGLFVRISGQPLARLPPGTFTLVTGQDSTREGLQTTITDGWKRLSRPSLLFSANMTETSLSPSLPSWPRKAKGTDHRMSDQGHRRKRSQIRWPDGYRPQPTTTPDVVLLGTASATDGSMKMDSGLAALYSKSGRG